jgi:hypothetical protein
MPSPLPYNPRMRLPHLAAILLILGGCWSAGDGGPRTPPVKIPPAYLPSAVSLAEKARRVERDLADYIAPEGVLLYRQLPDDERPPTERYRTLADQAAWTGCMLAAECYRYRATGDPAALSRARLLLAGVARLHDVTGVPGLLARCIAPGSRPAAWERGPWRQGKGRFRGLRWRGDVSKDQYPGILLGLAAVLDYLPAPSDRAHARRLAAAIADHLIDHGIAITGIDGETTTFGDLSSHALGVVPIGTNALIALAAVALADRAVPGQRYALALGDLDDEGYIRATAHPTFQMLGFRNRSNDIMAAISADVLLGPDMDPGLREAAAVAVNRLVAATAGEDNALIAAVAHTHLGSPTLKDAVRGLDLLPHPRPRVPIDNRDRADVRRSIWPSRAMTAISVDPPPVNRRGASSFVWKSDPYALTHDLDEAPGTMIYPGIDFLLPYWMLRARGAIDADR